MCCVRPALCSGMQKGKIQLYLQTSNMINLLTSTGGRKKGRTFLMKIHDVDVYISTGIMYLQTYYTMDICIVQSWQELLFISEISKLLPNNQIWSTT